MTRARPFIAYSRHRLWNVDTTVPAGWMCAGVIRHACGAAWRGVPCVESVAASPPHLGSFDRCARDTAMPINCDLPIRLGLADRSTRCDEFEVPISSCCTRLMETSNSNSHSNFGFATAPLLVKFAREQAAYVCELRNPNLPRAVRELRIGAPACRLLLRRTRYPTKRITSRHSWSQPQQPSCQIDLEQT